MVSLKRIRLAARALCLLLAIGTAGAFGGGAAVSVAVPSVTVASAATDTENFSIRADTVSLAKGERVRIIVSGSGMQAVSAYEVTLRSEGPLQYRTAQNLLPQAGFQAQSQRDGAWTYAYAAASAVSGDSDLCVFEFVGNGPGTALVTLVGVKTMDNAMAEIRYTPGQSVAVLITVDSGEPEEPVGPSPNPTPSGNSSSGPSNGSPAAGGTPAKPTPAPSPVARGVVHTDAELEASRLIAAVEPEALHRAAADRRGDAVIIRVQATADTANEASGFALNIPAEELRAAATAGLSRLQIESPLLQASISASSFLRLTAEGDAIIRLAMDIQEHEAVGIAQTAETAPTISAPGPSAAGVVYDIYLSADGYRLQEAAFGRGELAIRLPYTLQQGDDAKRLAVYRLGEDGSLKAAGVSRFESGSEGASGWMVFQPEELGRFVVRTAPGQFRDLDEAPWAVSEIEALAARGIVNGIGEDMFDPGSPVTRAQFVRMLVAALGFQAGEQITLEDQEAQKDPNGHVGHVGQGDQTGQTEPGFSDVRPDDWYAAAVAIAYSLGIVQGYEDGSFGAGKLISRQDMAVMAYRAARLAGIAGMGELGSDAGSYADADRIAVYAGEAVEFMNRLSIMSGIGEGIFAPTENSTRAQAAAVIYRLYARQPLFDE